MGQHGGARLGSPTVVSAGQTSQTLNALLPGAYRRIDVQVTFKIQNAANATSTLTVNTGSSMAAEGADDIDIILNALLASVQLRWDANNIAGNFTPAQWRTLLATLNQRDFTGTVINGASIPASGGTAKSYTIVMSFPVALDRLFQDGNIFQNGSRRLSEGELDYFFGANAAGTTSVVVGTGITASLTATAINVFAYEGEGTADDVGCVWVATRTAGYPTNVNFDSRPRLLVMDAATVPANAATSYNVGPWTLLDPNSAGSNYQADRLYAGGSDITARCTPLIWPRDHRTIEGFLTDIGANLSLTAVSGVTSLTLWDVAIVGPTPSAVSRVALHSGAGGPVTIQHPSPRSLPAGSRVPGGLLSILPARISPGGAAPGMGSAATVPGPAAAGVRQANANATAGGLARINQFFMGPRSGR